MYLKMAILRTYLLIFHPAVDQEHGGSVFSERLRK